MTKLLRVLAVLVYSLVAQAEELSPQLVGTWATEDSVFEGESLIGGTALYLNANGSGAMVGAPLPVGRCPDGRVCTPIIGFKLSAVLEKNGTSLLISIAEGSQSMSLTARYDANKDVLIGQFGNGSSTESHLIHRSSAVPEKLTGMLNDHP